MSNINKINFDKVKIITVAKVGSANFLHCDYINTKNKLHTHNLMELKNTLKKDCNCLIIVGIRNPIDRNLSYLFQTYKKNFKNTVKTKQNNYKGEYCYISELNEKDINKYTPEIIIHHYFKQNYHYTFNDWFAEFIELTKINQFDKEQGLQFYKFPNNNTIMIYTLEKISQNEKYICDKLGITGFKNSNDSLLRSYNLIYRKVKNTIKYKKEYLDSLLNTEIMNMFYTKGDIDKFYNKYKII